MKCDVIIIGAGPGGIFSAYELTKLNKDMKIAVFESGNTLKKRKCPIDGDKVKSCIKCKTCAIELMEYVDQINLSTYQQSQIELT